MFYENYLNSIKPDMSFIPESASINDMAIFTERSIQDTFNETFISLAMQEMTMFEKSINEADENASKNTSPEVKKEKLNKIANFFKNIWKSIKGFFLKLIDKVKAAFNKQKVEKGNIIKKDFNNALAQISNNKSKVGYKMDFNMYDAGTIKKIIDMGKESSNKLGSVADNAQKEMESNNSTGSTIEDVNRIISDVKNNLDEIKPQKKTSLTDVFDAQSQINDFVFDPSKTISLIKADYSNAKKMVDTYMQKAKELVNKDKDSNGFIKTAAKCLSAVTRVESIYINKLNSVRANYVSVIARVITVSKRAVKEDTEITIDVQENPDEDTKVDVKTEPEVSDTEIKDEVEEAFNAFLEEDKPEEGESKSVEDAADKDAKEIEDDVDDEPVEESALYQALVAFLA